MPASGKTREIAEQSLKAFFCKHQVVYYWTFTIVDLTTKDEAERRFKPFKDLVMRKGKEWLEFWELQERGAWHVHVVTDVYLDVNWLRPWMMERGWGPQMKVKRVQAARVWVPGKGWQLDDRRLWGLVIYLCKYLTKCFNDAGHGDAKVSYGKKKVFGGSARARIGTTRFAWAPRQTGRAGAYLYYYGRQFFRELYGEWPKWREMLLVMQLGVQVTGWADFDPFCEWIPNTS